MPSRFEWHGPQFERLVTQHFTRNLNAALILLVNHLKQLINVEGTGTTESEDGKGKQKKKLIYGESPSAPGEPPHKQTGRLLASVAWEVAGFIGRAGTNVKYGRWLELGTKKMAARPWLRRGLRELRATIAKILCKPMG